jgi:hypothetical protein
LEFERGRCASPALGLSGFADFIARLNQNNGHGITTPHEE